jgi:tetratricopeptide (TPR) repeat protein
MRLACALLLILAPLAAAAAGQPRSAPLTADAGQAQLVHDGALAIKSGMPQQAIDGALDKVIATYEQRYAKSARQVFCARTLVESLTYVAEAMKRKADALVLDQTWADAYKLKAYALVDLHRDAEARTALDKALALSPENADYLEELGAAYEREKNWPKALATFEHAERAAATFSPPEVKDDETARAWRGLGFVYVELGRLDDAEAVYLKCLALNKSDKRAAAELKYVRDLRAKQAQQ